MKQRQQKELAESLIAKVKKDLENPKTLQQVLNQSVLEVESEFHLRIPHWMTLTDCYLVEIMSAKA